MTTADEAYAALFQNATEEEARNRRIYLRVQCELEQLRRLDLIEGGAVFTELGVEVARRAKVFEVDATQEELDMALCAITEQTPVAVRAMMAGLLAEMRAGKLDAVLIKASRDSALGH